MWEYSLGLSGRGNFELALVRLNSLETERALAQGSNTIQHGLRKPTI